MEPERRIEKLLRAFAKKRREQAGDPLELHPVARQQLQKEIAQRASASRGGHWFGNFFLRPRLAFAFSFIMIAVVGLILWPILKTQKPSTLASSTLARDKTVAAEKNSRPLSPPPVSTVAPLAGTEGTRAFDDKPQTVSGSLAQKPVPAEPVDANRQRRAAIPEVPEPADSVKNTVAKFDEPAAVPTASAVNGFAGEGALSKDASAQPSVTAPPPAMLPGAMTNGTTFAANDESRKKSIAQKQPAPKASAAYFDRGKSESAAVIPPVSQAFNRSSILGTRQGASEALKSSSPVLVSFRVEQTGNAMRVVDADGSVYTGNVQLTPPASATRALAPKNVPAAAPAGSAGAVSPSVQNYSFRVAGTNRNLKQNVVFSGNLIPLTNGGPGLYGGNVGVGSSNSQSATTLPTELLLSNSRISGTATIGGQKEIEVLATPAP